MSPRRTDRLGSKAKSYYLDGHRFRSGLEYDRYCELKILLQAGEIFDLEMEPKMPLMAHGSEKVVTRYWPDFRYRETANPDVVVIDECKGYWTEVALLKKKWFEAQYPEIKYRVLKRKDVSIQQNRNDKRP